VNQRVRNGLLSCLLLAASAVHASGEPPAPGSDATAGTHQSAEHASSKIEDHTAPAPAAPARLPAATLPARTGDGANLAPPVASPSKPQGQAKETSPPSIPNFSKSDVERLIQLTPNAPSADKPKSGPGPGPAPPVQAAPELSKPTPAASVPDKARGGFGTPTSPGASRSAPSPLERPPADNGKGVPAAGATSKLPTHGVSPDRVDRPSAAGPIPAGGPGGKPRPEGAGEPSASAAPAPSATPMTEASHDEHGAKIPAPVSPAGGAQLPLPPGQAEPAPAVTVNGAANGPQETVQQDYDVDMRLAARKAASVRGLLTGSIVVPFAGSCGAAVFSRAGTTFIVFDERRPIDLAALRNDRLFGTASVRLLQNATLFQLSLPSDRKVALVPTPQGWRISILVDRPPVKPIRPVNSDGRINMTAEAPGQVVAILDPDSKATLLVGTQKQSGQGVVAPRRSAEFRILATSQGVVVEPLSDRVALHPTAQGFTLGGNPGDLQLSADPEADDLLADAGSLTRSFQFPTMPRRALSEHIVQQLNEIAAVPPLARGPRRVATARSLLAQGLAAEAHAMLQIAADQTPREGASIDLAALASIAAILAGRPEESEGLIDPRLTATDEITLWRAIRDAVLQPGSPRAASRMAATARLALTYPAAIRDRILPIIVETMVLGGEERAAAVLLDQHKDDQTLRYGRALLRQAKGDVPGALEELDALAGGRDQRDHSRAAVRAVELRLTAGQIDAKQAADQLEKLLYAWRGDAVELELRNRIAELRQQSGAWGQALTMLRETEAGFADEAPAMHARLQTAFANLLKDEAAEKIAPLDLVTLVEANADLLPPSGPGDGMEARLADRLLALDLPKRADPLLEKLMKSAPDGQGRATFGARLADLRLKEGGALAAIEALNASDPDTASVTIPPELADRRAMLFAQANASLGRIGVATATLAALATPEADAARATILEKAQDWPAAEQALKDYVGKTMPAAGPLDDHDRNNLVRLATAAMRAGDDQTLSELRAKDAGRIGDGPLADTFRLLTADPIRASSDLKRAAQENGFARSLPNGLKSVQTVR
jgi:hypothetical protein